MLDKQLIESEYNRCVAVLDLADNTMLLPDSKRAGVIGADGNEYAMKIFVPFSAGPPD